MTDAILIFLLFWLTGIGVRTIFLFLLHAWAVSPEACTTLPPARPVYRDLAIISGLAAIYAIAATGSEWPYLGRIALGMRCMYVLGLTVLTYMFVLTEHVFEGGAYPGIFSALEADSGFLRTMGSTYCEYLDPEFLNIESPQAPLAIDGAL